MKSTLILILLPIVIGCGEIKNKEFLLCEPEIVLTELPLTIENLLYTLEYYEVKYPDIVVKQYILETGWGKSYTCRTKNNLFGLTNPRNKQYFEFTHWTESVKGYRDMVQYKYRKGDYFTFLLELPYAEDPLYINKLKRIQYDIQ